MIDEFRQWLKSLEQPPYIVVRNKHNGYYDIEFSNLAEDRPPVNFLVTVGSVYQEIEPDELGKLSETRRRIDPDVGEELEHTKLVTFEEIPDGTYEAQLLVGAERGFPDEMPRVEIKVPTNW